MAYIAKLTNEGGVKSLNRYVSMLAGNTAYIDTAYESIATVDVGVLGAGTITFSSIPSTYTHLQMRYTYRVNSSNTSDEIYVNLNGSASSNANHLLSGNGSTVSATALTYTSVIYTGVGIGGTSTANVFGVGIIDILDYTNTNKYKTIRSLNGYDANGSGVIQLASGFNYADLTTLTSLSIRSNSNFSQYSSFALYGIKG